MKKKKLAILCGGGERGGRGLLGQVSLSYFSNLALFQQRFLLNHIGRLMVHSKLGQGRGEEGYVEHLMPLLHQKEYSECSLCRMQCVNAAYS